MTSASDGVSTLIWTYDAIGRVAGRVSDADGPSGAAAVTTWTVSDGMHAYADVNAAGIAGKRYLVGPGSDEWLARSDATGDADWYVADRLGTVRQVRDGSSGAQEYRADFDEFGIKRSEAGASGDRFGSAGREVEAGVGLVQNRARLYDPAQNPYIYMN